MNYFNVHNTPQENKDLYKSYCKQLHPDMPTGNEAAFIEMKKQYDTIVELQANPKKSNDFGQRLKFHKEYYYSEAEKIFDKSAEVLKQEARETLKNAGINTIEDLFNVLFRVHKKRK